MFLRGGLFILAVSAHNFGGIYDGEIKDLPANYSPAVPAFLPTAGLVTLEGPTPATGTAKSVHGLLANYSLTPATVTDQASADTYFKKHANYYLENGLIASHDQVKASETFVNGTVDHTNYRLCNLVFADVDAKKDSKGADTKKLRDECIASVKDAKDDATRLQWFTDNAAKLNFPIQNGYVSNGLFGTMAYKNISIKVKTIKKDEVTHQDITTETEKIYTSAVDFEKFKNHLTIIENVEGPNLCYIECRDRSNCFWWEYNAFAKQCVLKSQDWVTVASELGKPEPAKDEPQTRQRLLADEATDKDQVKEDKVGGIAKDEFVKAVCGDGISTICGVLPGKCAYGSDKSCVILSGQPTDDMTRFNSYDSELIAKADENNNTNEVPPTDVLINLYKSTISGTRSLKSPAVLRDLTHYKENLVETSKIKTIAIICAAIILLLALLIGAFVLYKASRNRRKNASFKNKVSDAQKVSDFDRA